MLRLGELDYINALPLGMWEPEPGAQPLQRFRSTPSRLYELLRQGQLDVSPVSSLAYWRSREELALLPDLAISAAGPVQSVTLYTRAPLEQLGPATIGVTPASITSVALLRLLLEDAGSRDLSFQTAAEAALTTFPERFSGILLIGDAALVARYLRPPPAPWQAHDLGELWWRRTGLPMVFAVWATRRTWADGHEPELERLQQHLLASRDAFRRDPEPVLSRAEAAVPIGREALASYYGCLHFGFGEKESQGLQRFGELVQDSALPGARIS